MEKLTKRFWLITVVTVMVAGLVIFAGCGQQKPKTVDLVYVNWAEGIAMTNLAKVAFEDLMGYQCNIQVADVGPVYTSVAQGDRDAFLDAWLPVTHADYMERFKDDIVDLGYTFQGARIGLVVPAYADINSIEEMNKAKKKFDSEIIGIDAGAGIMKASEKAIEEYDLDYKLVASSGPAMTASLSKAIEDEEWEVVTGWKPHWKFARWDLKFLEDPKKIYGEVENIHCVARKGLEEDMPKVYTFLKNFEMNDQQLGSLMGMIADSDGEPEAAARKWLEKPENKALVESWMPKD
ncbi:glycine/betaine ABC transporter [bacterium]|nr:glycine/betaine ABC transporter [bacterium]